jgi:hypothetical protein
MLAHRAHATLAQQRPKLEALADQWGLCNTLLELQPRSFSFRARRAAD